jgi:hypothetical protein
MPDSGFEWPGAPREGEVVVFEESCGWGGGGGAWLSEGGGVSAIDAPGGGWAALRR